MPFSWKTKSRRNRFSQLVADHLQSPKRGGSLVVETGFPTSLIDLYVRNRGRFRKSTEKKQRGNDSLNPLSPCLSSPASASSADLNCFSSSSSFVDLNSSSSANSDYRGAYEIIEEDVVVAAGTKVTTDDEIKIENHYKTKAEMSVGMVKLNHVLVVALKVLFMVFLVLGTKRLTVGITMSAFLLFFLELVENRLFRRSISTHADSNSLFESGLQETKNMKTLKETATLVVCSEVLEIAEQVKSNPEVKSDEVRSQALMEITCKSSRRAVMKSRMKKLVPKKLRKCSKHEICCDFKEEEEETLKSTQILKPVVFSNECSESTDDTLCILEQHQDKIVEIVGRSLSSTLSSEIECNDKELGTDLQQNPGCLILFFIVLVGLIGGRIMALVIALSWCWMLKKLQLRNVKFPIS